MNIFSSELLYAQSKFQINQTFTTAGTYTITIGKTGKYLVEMYGAGGGFFSWAYQKASGWDGGGSGAGFRGVIRIPKGTYAVAVGSYNGNATTGGSTSLGSLITAGGGGYDTHGYGSNPKGWCIGYGDGGVLTIPDSSIIVSSTLSSNGRVGGHWSYDGGGTYSSATGGLSLYNNTSTGYGAGSSASGVGYAGYFKIVTA